jgi:hypothetical protein
MKSNPPLGSKPSLMMKSSGGKSRSMSWPSVMVSAVCLARAVAASAILGLVESFLEHEG